MKTILIIDDEVDLCTLMKHILEGTALYRVIAAHNGKYGEQLAVQDAPDLIFLDFVMPGEKGDKVIAFLKKTPETKRIPIVLMSGLGEMVYLPKDHHHWKWLPNTEIVKDRGDLPKALKWKMAPEEVAQELGIAAYLHKPFSEESLLELVASILKKENISEDPKEI